ncbi:MAG TPA: hypothetical protein VMS77_04070 [Conexivisphaerales archaeon]|nr:hypothetical protein [Conexivisphaerales archaeon]
MALAEISEVESIVRELFQVKDVCFKGSSAAEFKVCESPDNERNFAELVRVLRPKGFLPLLRSTGGSLVIYVESIKGLPKRKFYLPLILSCVTFATVAADAWLKSSALEGAISRSGVVRDTVLYFAFMLAYLLVPYGVKYLFSLRSGAPPPIPYFIPGLPATVPTFGPLYAAGEPPLNKGSDFKPTALAAISGLVIASAALFVGLLDTRLLTQEAASAAFGSSAHFVVQQLPLGLGYLINVLYHPSSQSTLLSPLVFAGWFCFLISFVNMVPTRQLEGSRLSSGIFGRRTFSAASLVSLFVTVFVNPWMALFLFAVSWGSRELYPLDNVSPVPRRNVYLYGAFLAIAAAIYLLILYPPLPAYPALY